MAYPRMEVGLWLRAQPPLSDLRLTVWAARLLRLDTVIVPDHLQDFIPRTLWDPDITWLAGRSDSPHECFDYQTLLGYLAPRAGRVRLGVGVTQPLLRHPVAIAQAMLTVAHMTKRPPILGVGSGERMNTEPYGLSSGRPVGRLEEALQVIRLCFAAEGPINFRGEHFQLEDAIFDLRAPRDRTPAIWIAAHGPRTLGLVGRYGDGWYPAMLSVEEYQAGLATIHDSARAASRDPAAITPALHPILVLASSEAEARVMLESRLGRLLTLHATADFWQRRGAEHPFGRDFRGYVDILPEQRTKDELEAAIAAVPFEVTADYAIWGTPSQVLAKLRAYGEVGCRQVIPILGSATLSRRSALYSLRALRKIAKALRTGQ